MSGSSSSSDRSPSAVLVRVRAPVVMPVVVLVLVPVVVLSKALSGESRHRGPPAASTSAAVAAAALQYTTSSPPTALTPERQPPRAVSRVRGDVRDPRRCMWCRAARHSSSTWALPPLVCSTLSLLSHVLVTRACACVSTWVCSTASREVAVLVSWRNMRSASVVWCGSTLWGG